MFIHHVLVVIIETPSLLWFNIQMTFFFVHPLRDCFRCKLCKL